MLTYHARGIEPPFIGSVLVKYSIYDKGIGSYTSKLPKSTIKMVTYCPFKMLPAFSNTRKR